MEAQHDSTDSRACRVGFLYAQLADQVSRLPADRRKLLERVMMKNIAAELLAAIKSSGLSHYEIARRAGIAPAQLDRFVSGERDLRLKSAAAIATVLDLTLSPSTKPTKGATRGKATRRNAAV